MIKRMAGVLAVAAGLMLAGAGVAAAAEPGEHQEYQCSPGLLGTGLLCNSAPQPGPPPEDDIFQGGPLGADSPLAQAVGGLLG